MINFLRPCYCISTNQEESIYSKQTIIRLLIVFTICFNFRNRRSFTIKKQTFLVSNKVKPQNNHQKTTRKSNIIIRYDKNKVTVQMFSGLLTYMYNDCAIIHGFIGGNVKCDVGPCHFTVGDNL